MSRNLWTCRRGLLVLCAGLSCVAMSGAASPGLPSGSGEDGDRVSPPVAIWNQPGQIGIVPDVDTAALPGRAPSRDNYFPMHKYPDLLLYKPEGSEATDGSDSDVGPIDRMIRGDIRSKPFPETVWFQQITDYYGRREELWPKIAARVAAVPEPNRLVAHRNQAWLLLYLGDFSHLLRLYGPEGEHAELGKNDGSLSFTVAQAFYRLGRYAESLPYANHAYDELTDSILDTRWQIMLSELGLHGRSYLDQADGQTYTRRHIRTLFPHRSFEGFPFEDVTDQLGVARWGGTGSVSFADLDLDGWDELVWEHKYFPPNIYRNVDGKEFRPISREALASPLASPIIFTPGDFNNDRLPDLFRHCCNYDSTGPTQLLENLGDLRFADVTESSGLAYDEGAGMVVAWSDYDLDGDLDLLIGDAEGPSRLYRNEGSGKFEEVTEAAGVITPRSVGLAFGDYDNDGWPDIWVLGWDSKKLFRNNGDGTFEDVTEQAGIDPALGKKGYMAFFFDYNNDTHLDLFTGQYVVSSDERWGFGPICTCSNLLADEGYSDREWKFATTIFKNNGDGTFTNIYEKSRFVPLGMMGSNHGDWNNDGYEDLLMGAGGPYYQQAEPFLFYENNGDDTFDLITPFEMLGLWGKGHGSAFADFDRDGFLDVATNNGGAAPGDIWPSLVLRNKGNENHWLQVNLRAEKAETNATAVGARVTVHADGMVQTKELQAGGQFGATNSFTLHFGLAQAKKVDRIVVRWPNRDHQETVLVDVDIDQRIEVFEAEGRYEVVFRRPIPTRSFPDSHPTAGR